MDTGQSIPLQQAKSYLLAGQDEEARALLIDFVRQVPDSEQGWLLLGMTMHDSKQQAECYRRVLKINPNNTQAKTLLQRLQTPDVPLTAPAPSTPIPPSTLLKPVKAEAQPAPRPAAQSFGEDDKDTVKDAKKPQPIAETSKPVQTRKALKKNILPLIIAAASILVLAMVCITGAYLTIQTFMQSAAEIVPLQATTLAGMATLTMPAEPTTTAQSGFVLPPTWTPTPTPTSTLTPTITPTPQPTGTSTLMPPAPTDNARMDRIEQEVSDLRGLPILTSVPRYIVTRERARQALSDLLIDETVRDQLRDEARMLSALGLINPTYDLVNYTLNGLVDGIGGVYITWTKQIFVLGLSFSGMEHFIYAHEFDHALTDQHFNINGMGVYPRCLSNEQRCAAIRALIEGDATLLMLQWVLQYATPQDYQDLLRYRPPVFSQPDENPPPYIAEDLNFPYKYGLKFVEFLHKRGNWAEVNRAYQRLPESTEQILHPEKYLSGELPYLFQDVPLGDVLGPKWRMLKSDVLGEWTTYLILSYGADVGAQVPQQEASTAAAGWKGDQYQIYYSEDSDSTALAAHWVWDTPNDGQEFVKAMTFHLDNRFRGARMAGQPGTCWQSQQQIACLYGNETDTLWLMAPDLATLDTLRLLHPWAQ